MQKKASQQDSLQVERKGKRSDKQCSSHPSTLLGAMQKKNSTTTYRGREKCSKWTPHQDAVYWIHLTRAQEKGLQFWQTRSHAIVVLDSVPADCIEKVVSMKGQKLKINDTPRLGQLRIVSQKCPEIKAAAARHERQWETACGATPRQPYRHSKKPKKHRETCCGGRA